MLAWQAFHIVGMAVLREIPQIFPVIHECDARDVVIVHLTRAERPDVPTASRPIMNRMQEISFNSSLIREMRAVAFVTKLMVSG